MEEVIHGGRLKAKAVFGLFDAHATGDDIEVMSEAGEHLATFHMLRQQKQKALGRPQLSLADYVGEKGMGDSLGAFVVTAGIGLQELVEEAEANHDDYRSILLKSLADRLAEAFAEKLHESVRKEFWGYASDEALENEDLIQCRYRGIRPAPGYPACPEHTEKGILFSLLNAEEKIGVSLTETFAMNPAASVSGFYFAHPQARYFGLGPIGEDQAKDYATRKGFSLDEAKKWLAENLREDAS